jgi:hypothetical protein
MLQDPIFLFWLTVFSRIMPHCDILYQLQKTCMDAVEIQQCIKTFEDSIQKERNNIDSVQNEIPASATQVKRRRANEDPYLSKIVAAKEICDTIINHCKDRFSFTNHLSAANLFLTKQFSKFEKVFPIDYLNCATEAYPFLNEVRLKTELEIIYKRPDFRNMSRESRSSKIHN